MNSRKPPYEELEKRLERAEAVLDSLRRGEIDQVVGADGPLVVRVKSLVEENERLAREWQTTFDCVNDAIWFLDRDQRILRSNRTAERLFGRAREEFIGRHCWEIVHQTSMPIPECPILHARHSLRRESMEMPIGDRWFEVTVDPILDENGNYAGAVHIVSDITERKKAEDALRESEALFRSIFHDHAAVKLIIDPEEGRIMDANNAAVDFYGWSREQLLSMRILDINTLPPEEVKKKMELVQSQGRAYFEVQHRRADGTIRDVAVLGGKIEIKGKPFLHTIVQDISKRKQAEAEIRRLQTAIEQGGESIVVTDRAGAIQYVNAAFEQVTGYRKGEAIGRTPRLLKSGKQDEAFYRDLWETITHGRTWRGHMVNRRKDGTLYTEESTISPVFDTAGKIVNYMAVKRDITEHL